LAVLLERGGEKMTIRELVKLFLCVEVVVQLAIVAASAIAWVVVKLLQC